MNETKINVTIDKIDYPFGCDGNYINKFKDYINTNSIPTEDPFLNKVICKKCKNYRPIWVCKIEKITVTTDYTLGKTATERGNSSCLEKNKTGCCSDYSPKDPIEQIERLFRGEVKKRLESFESRLGNKLYNGGIVLKNRLDIQLEYLEENAKIHLANAKYLQRLIDQVFKANNSMYSWDDIFLWIGSSLPFLKKVTKRVKESKWDSRLEGSQL